MTQHQGVLEEVVASLASPIPRIGKCRFWGGDIDSATITGTVKLHLGRNKKIQNTMAKIPFCECSISFG